MYIKSDLILDYDISFGEMEFVRNSALVFGDSEQACCFGKNTRIDDYSLNRDEKSFHCQLQISNFSIHSQKIIN